MILPIYARTLDFLLGVLTVTSIRHLPQDTFAVARIRGWVVITASHSRPPSVGMLTARGNVVPPMNESAVVVRDQR